MLAVVPLTIIAADLSVARNWTEKSRYEVRLPTEAEWEPDEILNYHYKYQTTEDKAAKFWSIGRPDRGRRILRGGGWCTPGVGNQSGFRRHEQPHNHLWYFSFRVAVTPKSLKQ